MASNCMGAVSRLRAQYGLQIDASDKGTGPGQRVELADVLPALAQHNRARCASLRGQTVDEETYAPWDFECTAELVSKGMRLRDGRSLRPHQERALAALLDERGRARSGCAKLPCGAGKTLFALAHLARLETCALICTNSNMASEHWHAQLEHFFEPPRDGVIVVTAETHTARLHTVLARRPAVVICTYQLLTVRGQTSETAACIALLLALPYGLLVLDEAQTAVADQFRRVLQVPHVAALAVSATFMREDGEMEVLFERLGPVLVEVERQALVEQGHLARVERVEVHVKDTSPGGRADELNREIVHPRKLALCAQICEWHTSRNGNVIVFCDLHQPLARVHEVLAFVLDEERVLGPLTMHTPAAERIDMLARLRGGPGHVLCISRVGDTSIDLPGATALVQVSCTNGGQNQELQRTGRVQRPAPRSATEPHPPRTHVAYTLVTCDSDEMRHVVGRRECMEREGYPSCVLAEGTREDIDAAPMMQIVEDMLALL